MAYITWSPDDRASRDIGMLPRARTFKLPKIALLGFGTAAALLKTASIGTGWLMVYLAATPITSNPQQVSLLGDTRLSSRPLAALQPAARALNPAWSPLAPEERAIPMVSSPVGEDVPAILTPGSLKRVVATPNRLNAPNEIPLPPVALRPSAPREMALAAIPTPLPPSLPVRIQNNSLRRPLEEEKSSSLTPLPAPKLAMIPPPSAPIMAPPVTPPSVGSGTAIYDLDAHMVTLPNGERLEAHSGLGEFMDDPRRVSVRMHGATPPNTYRLTLRESLFHGVAALRLTPIGSSPMYGRAGLLAHTYMLGPRGDSNGCISFKDYDRFLQAFQRGEINKIVVVTHMGGGFAPSRLFARVERSDIRDIDSSR